MRWRGLAAPGNDMHAVEFCQERLGSAGFNLQTLPLGSMKLAPDRVYMEILVKNFEGGAQIESMKDVVLRRLAHSAGQIKAQRPYFHVAPESFLELALRRNKQLLKLGRPLDQGLAVVRKRKRDKTPAGKPAPDFAKNHAAQKSRLR